MQGHLEYNVDVRVPFRSALLESERECLGKVAGRDIEHFLVFGRQSHTHKDLAHVFSHVMLCRYQSLARINHSREDGPCFFVLIQGERQVEFIEVLALTKDMIFMLRQH